MADLTLTSVVRRGSGQISAGVQGEAVVLALPGGVYYGLNQVGTRVWDLIQEPMAVRTVCDRLEAEYEIDEESLTPDVIGFLEELWNAGLLEVAHGS